MFLREDTALFVDEILCRIAFSLAHVEDDSKKMKGIKEAFDILTARKSADKDQSVVAMVTP